MIKASVITLYLSIATMGLIDPIPTPSVAITKYLNAIANRIAPEITTLKLDCNPRPLDRKVSIVLNANTHNLLLRATLSNPSLSLNSAVDILLRTFVPTIRDSGLIVGTKAESCRLGSPDMATTQAGLEALPLEEYSQIKLQYGCLVPKRRDSGKEYWYWRYYVGDKRTDDYIKGNLDRVLAYVDRIGVPPKARPKRLNKAKKTWSVKVA